jgi:lysozyme
VVGLAGQHPAPNDARLFDGRGSRSRHPDTLRVIDPVAILVAMVLAKRWEGFISHPYLCPAGVPSIGFGFTHYADGRRVKLTDPPMTREEATVLLEYLIRTKYGAATARLCPGVSGARLGALTDFCFNLGDGNLRASTLRQKVNAGLWEQVPAQLRRWTKAGGKVLKGLVLRREAEILHI